VRLEGLIRKIVLKIGALRRPSVAYCAGHDLLPGVIVRTPAARLRKILLLPESEYEAQLNQDIFALLANRFKPGFFIEIGANDGFTLSNTVYLEEKFGWNGILVEANPRYVESLRKRKSKSVVAAVVENEGYYKFYNAGLYGGVAGLIDRTHENKTKDTNSISVWGTTLECILIENNVPEIVNFISVDVEGAEVQIVEQMCQLEGYRFSCGCIEYNSRKEDYQRIKCLLRGSGYRIVWEGQTRQDLFFVDEKGLVASG